MEILEQDISSIIRDKMLIEKLKNVGINTIRELSSYSQKELAEKQIQNLYIKDIIIALQCNGLDLKSARKKRWGEVFYYGKNNR